LFPPRQINSGTDPGWEAGKSQAEYKAIQPPAANPLSLRLTEDVEGALFYISDTGEQPCRTLTWRESQA
jgi:hypothetical protein